MSQKFIGVTLPIRLGRTGMFDSSVNLIQQVRSNFKNLILTKKGERVGQPELGCDIWKILFEPLTNETLEDARLSVSDALEQWMPFLELTNFEITKIDDENTINIKCDYRFRSNPNVTDSLTILANALGSLSVQDTVISESATPTTEQLTGLARTRTRRQKEINATRIRRP